MGTQRVASELAVQTTVYSPMVSNTGSSSGAASTTEAFKTLINASNTIDQGLESQVPVSSNDPWLDNLNAALTEFGEATLTRSDVGKELPTIESIYPDLSPQSSYKTTSTARVIYWYHPDYIGNVDLVSDMSGEAYEFFLYNPWGENLYEWSLGTSTWTSPYRFNGKELDQETGFHYYGARYYNPNQSVWLSVDILHTYSSYESPYVFVSSNPIKFIDPDGRIKRDSQGNIVYTPTGKMITAEHPSGPTATMELVIIYTNAGSEVEAYINVSDNHSFDTNCHGTTFADGQFWINNDQVQTIINDEYELIDQGLAMVSDVVVYDDNNGSSAHSVTVSNVENETVEVTGLGGLQTKTSETDIENGWNGSGTTYQTYRKTFESIKAELYHQVMDQLNPQDNVKFGVQGDASDGIF